MEAVTRRTSPTPTSRPRSCGAPPARRRSTPSTRYRSRRPRPPPAAGRHLLDPGPLPYAGTWRPHTKVDEWMGDRIRGRTNSAPSSTSSAPPASPRRSASRACPGPTLHAEVGDVLEVHFRNADQPLRPGGDHALRTASATTPSTTAPTSATSPAPAASCAPARSSPTRWECVPGSVGAWPYHDHGPNHTAEHHARALRRDRRPPQGHAAARRRDHRLHALLPAPDHRPRRRRVPSTAAPARATPRRSGPRWASAWPSTSSAATATSTPSTSTATAGRRSGGRPWTTRPSARTRRSTPSFTEDNPGRWLYHCHVFTHQDAGMAGWYLVEP